MDTIVSVRADTFQPTADALRPDVILPVHPMTPRSTARRGTARMTDSVLKALPPRLGRDERDRLIRNGEVDPSAAYIVWSVRGQAKTRPITKFEVPNGLSLAPVRRIGTYPKAPNRVGMYPVVRDDHILMLTVESRLEGSWLRYFDIHPSVDWIHAQPFALYWPVGRKSILRIPDFLIRLDGQWVVIDVKPDEDYEADTSVKGLFDLTASTLGTARVGYSHVGSMPQQQAANLHIIAPHKPVDEDLLPDLQEALARRPQFVGNLIDMSPDFGRSRDVLLTLLANGRCGLDLTQEIREASKLTWYQDTEASR